MKSPLALSVWFISCVSLGLLLAWLDGIPLDAIMKAALTAAGFGVSLAAIAWVVKNAKGDNR